jgi:TRAP-type uncharacterized transport system substrate-binding protein
VVRADSPLNFVHEIGGARINAGPAGSGTALTTLTLYQSMFHAPLPRSTSFLSNEDALVRLTADQDVDVVVIVGGQPMKLLADMKPEARQLIRLLKVDPDEPRTREALRTYFSANVRASSYPNLLQADLPALAVKAFLVTYDYNLQGTVQALTRFARALCDGFDELRDKGHAKWKEVDFSLPDLGEGWSYYPPTMRQLRACRSATLASRRERTCSQMEDVLGLCADPGAPARHAPAQERVQAPGMR